VFAHSFAVAGVELKKARLIENALFFARGDSRYDAHMGGYTSFALNTWRLGPGDANMQDLPFSMSLAIVIFGPYFGPDRFG
jgi:hypothetical protein